LRAGLRQEEFKEGFYSLDSKLVAAAGLVLEADPRYSRFGSAVRGMLRDRLEAGEAPIVDRRPQVNIQNNTQVNTIKISQERMRQIAVSNPAAVREYLATGMKPPELEV
jgi:hypothetical protein